MIHCVDRKANKCVSGVTFRSWFSPIMWVLGLNLGYQACLEPGTILSGPSDLPFSLGPCPWHGAIHIQGQSSHLSYTSMEGPQTCPEVCLLEGLRSQRAASKD